MASISIPCPKISFVSARAGSRNDQQQPPAPPQQQKQTVCFNGASRPNPSLSFCSFPSVFSGVQSTSRKISALGKVHAKLNEATAEKSSNCVPVAETKPEVSSPEEKTQPEAPKSIPDASTISAFLNQVSSLVKLVDSKDIMELEMKQDDCEILIRKKEALQAPAPAAPMPPQMPYPMYGAPPPAATPAAAPSTPSAHSASAPAPKAAPPKAAPSSSHPPMKCPMAGTFYRCPAPGEPPFIKVGDKVQKGQVICIIEAMKLMNEIEADQSGTITEILAEDGKPVSVDTPLLVISP